VNLLVKMANAPLRQSSSSQSNQQTSQEEKHDRGEVGIPCLFYLIFIGMVG